MSASEMEEEGDKKEKKRHKKRGKACAWHAADLGYVRLLKVSCAGTAASILA